MTQHLIYNEDIKSKDLYSFYLFVQKIIVLHIKTKILFKYGFIL